MTKIDRLARSTSDLYRIISELAEKGVAFRVVDDPSIDTTSRTGKLGEEPEWERLAELAGEPVDMEAWQAWTRERGTSSADGS